MTWNQRQSIQLVRMHPIDHASFQTRRRQALAAVELMATLACHTINRRMAARTRNIRTIPCWTRRIVTVLGRCFLQWPNRRFLETQIRASVSQILRVSTQNSWKKDCSWPRPSWRSSILVIRSSKNTSSILALQIYQRCKQHLKQTWSIKSCLTKLGLTCTKRIQREMKLAK